MSEETRAAAPTIPFREALKVWTRIGLLSFGGPAGQIAMMHRVLVEEKRWIGNDRFLHALNFCHLLPGPEAQQLAVYVGWLLHRTWGGLVAGTLFILPGFLVVLGLTMLYAGFREVPAVAAVFYGLKPAVLAIVLQAVLRIGRKSLRTPYAALLAGGAFLALFLFQAPFPAVVATAALLGWLGGSACPQYLGDACPGWVHAPGGSGHRGETAGGVVDNLLEAGAPAHTQPSLRRSLRTLAVWLALWWGPVAALALLFGPHDVFVRIGVFFSKMAVVTFGGAYAVLSYVAQAAVADYGWLAPDEMLSGLALAETTPGPLILVLQFVGFLAAYRAPGALSPMLAGTLGAALTVWVTFTPCFLWIFLGAPYVERLRHVAALREALAGVTAAVVGVVLNLALWFGLHTMFGRVGETDFAGMALPIPDWVSLDPAALALALAALAAVTFLRAGMFTLLAGSAAAGLLCQLIL